MLQSLHKTIKYYSNVDNNIRSAAARFFNQTVKWAKTYSQIGYLIELKNKHILPPSLESASFLPPILQKRASSIHKSIKFKHSLLREYISENFRRKKLYADEISRLRDILLSSDNDKFKTLILQSQKELLSKTLTENYTRLRKKVLWNQKKHENIHCDATDHKRKSNETPEGNYVSSQVQTLIKNIPPILDTNSGLPSLLKSHGFSIMNSKPDGHCLLYSWENCTGCSYTDIINKLSKYAKKNKDKYEPFGFNIEEFDKFLNNKTFDQNTVDLIPHILAVIFSVSVYIININNNFHTNIHFIDNNSNSNKQIVLLRTNDNHFDAVVRREVSTNDNHFVADIQREVTTNLEPIANNPLPSHICSNSKDILVTDLSKTLNTNELKLLSKGPKFAIQNKLDDNTLLDIKASFSHLVYQIRWKKYIKENYEKYDIPKYPYTDLTQVPPNADCETESKLQRAYHGILRIVDYARKHPPIGNLTKQEKLSITSIKNKGLTCLPSDKGTEFCVVKNTEYINAGLKHLGDNNTYKSIKHIKASTIENKLNCTWKRICTESEQPIHIKRSFITKNSNIPEFYHLIKTHKKSDSLKIRPIVANYDSPTTKLSWLLSRILKPLLRTVPAHLERSSDLIEEIKSLQNQTKEYDYPFSLDVTALYTSIPPIEAINNIRSRLNETNLCNQVLTTDHIVDLLTVILNNTYFTYQQNIFKQITGLPMGNSLSGTLAILYMDTLERNTILQCYHIGLYKRYVDDILILTSNKENANIIYSKFNHANEHIKFEIEHPKVTKDNNSKTLSLLDFTLCMNNESQPSFSFYSKEAKRNLFIHHNSALPMKMKLNTIQNEMKRITERCSNEEDKNKHIKELDEKLHLNGYPKGTTKIKTKIKNKNKTVPEKKKIQEYNYFKFPYLGEKIQHKVHSLFKALDLPIRTYYNPITLRSLFKEKIPLRCILPGCQVKNKSICSIKHCVYEIRCSCGNNYIGSTIRSLHIRYKEHLNDTNSPIFRHIEMNDKHKTDIHILTKEKNTNKLRIKEAYLIRQIKPTLNTQEEIANSLIFDI